MIKLKKKITRLKTHHFLKEKRLVLFFHCNYKKKSNKNLDMIQPLLLSKEKKNVLLIRNKITQALIFQLANGSSLPGEHKDEAFHIHKESLAKGQALHSKVSTYARFDKISVQLNTHERELAAENSSTVFSTQHCKDSHKMDLKQKISVGVEAIVNAQKESCSQQPSLSQVSLPVSLQESNAALARLCLQKAQKDAVLYGPNVFLGITKMSQLEKVLEEYRKQDAFVLLGGFYDNQVVNHLQIRRLGLLSKKESNSFLYLELLDCIKKPALQALSTMKGCTPLFCLKEMEYKLIQALNLRIDQLKSLRKQVTAKDRLH